MSNFDGNLPFTTQLKLIKYACTTCFLPRKNGQHTSSLVCHLQALRLIIEARSNTDTAAGLSALRVEQTGRLQNFRHMAVQLGAFWSEISCPRVHMPQVHISATLAAVPPAV
jgi:hypothetical protein